VKGEMGRRRKGKEAEERGERESEVTWRWGGRKAGIGRMDRRGGKDVDSFHLSRRRNRRKCNSDQHLKISGLLYPPPFTENGDMNNFCYLQAAYQVFNGATYSTGCR